jgi:hypothetical protein
MELAAIFRQLEDLEVSVRADHGEIVLNPGDRVPADLRAEIAQQKGDLLDRLTRRDPGESELIDIARRVIDDGSVLLWSNVLSDFVAFVRTDADATNVPRHFTVYSLDELMSLFGDQEPSENELRLIHQAKKFGGRVVDEQ